MLVWLLANLGMILTYGHLNTFTYNFLSKKFNDDSSNIYLLKIMVIIPQRGIDYTALLHVQA